MRECVSEIRVGVTGGGWITTDGYGRLSRVHPDAPGKVHKDAPHLSPVLRPGKAVIPPRGDVFDRPLRRWGRFDAYTRLGCAAIALSLRDAGLGIAAEDTRKHPIGIVSSSRWESMSVDQAYYRTTLAQDGVLASPNLFSYTLPGIMQGECAVHFGLTGPTLCVGEEGESKDHLCCPGKDRLCRASPGNLKSQISERPSLRSLGATALRTALRLMAARTELAMIAGWLDDPPEEHGVGGALFVVLERHPRRGKEPIHWIRYRSGRMWLDDGRPVGSLLDLFDRKFEISNLPSGMVHIEVHPTD